MLIEPPRALRPRTVPCGPTFTSTRSMSKNATPRPRGRGTYTSSRCGAIAGSPRSVLALPAGAAPDRRGVVFVVGDLDAGHRRRQIDQAVGAHGVELRLLHDHGSAL